MHLVILSKLPADLPNNNCTILRPHWNNGFSLPIDTLGREFFVDLFCAFGYGKSIGGGWMAGNSLEVEPAIEFNS
ncbi:hypothetical protein SAY87_025676 [Trapa incisa]|uniref:Uncharacterized protein n=1 Tax=Trapa incisa TaxID=236973 RepID=A0AAN7GYH4_9MYRT|nr:hypothetical protein SAY87_025676 [Trapa incisa]